MTNQTILSLFDYLCNEARNSVHAGFGLMALRPDLAADPNWQRCVEASKSSAERLLHSIDDVRELLSPDAPASELAEEFDLMLCLGETIEVLNLAAGEDASRLILQPPAAPLVGRQDRRAVEQALTRVLHTVSKLSPRGEVRVMAASLPDGGGARFTIRPHNSNIALRVADWLNADPAQVNFKDADEVLFGVATLVAGKKIRALGGAAEFQCDARLPMGLTIALPWRTEPDAGRSADPVSEDSALNILVAEDCDESFVLTGILLRREAVWRAQNGLEAIDLVKKRRFDIVLMDVHMPGMDGYRAIRSIREWETQTGNARTPIVVLSSDDLDTQTRSAAQSGCSGFLRKPLNNRDLTDLLQRLKEVRTLSA
ncbi:MAG TPA: response regulator [Bryobacteraceae bacterium]|nr:response regulator [Bryobacteraceae bacterium]